MVLNRRHAEFSSLRSIRTYVMPYITESLLICEVTEEKGGALSPMNIFVTYVRESSAAGDQLDYSVHRFKWGPV